MCGEPLALTSANITSQSSTVAAQVCEKCPKVIGELKLKVYVGLSKCLCIYFFYFKEFQELWPKLAVVVDGGAIGDQNRLGSTVVDLSVIGKYRIIRPGW